MNAHSICPRSCSFHRLYTEDKIFKPLQAALTVIALIGAGAMLASFFRYIPSWSIGPAGTITIFCLIGFTVLTCKKCRADKKGGKEVESELGKHAIDPTFINAASAKNDTVLQILDVPLKPKKSVQVGSYLVDFDAKEKNLSFYHIETKENTVLTQENNLCPKGYTFYLLEKSGKNLIAFLSKLSEDGQDKLVTRNLIQGVVIWDTDTMIGYTLDKKTDYAFVVENKIVFVSNFAFNVYDLEKKTWVAMKVHDIPTYDKVYACHEGKLYFPAKDGKRQVFDLTSGSKGADLPSLTYKDKEVDPAAFLEQQKILHKEVDKPLNQIKFYKIVDGKEILLHETKSEVKRSARDLVVHDLVKGQPFHIKTEFNIDQVSVWKDTLILIGFDLSAKSDSRSILYIETHHFETGELILKRKIGLSNDELFRDIQIVNGKILAACDPSKILIYSPQEDNLTQVELEETQSALSKLENQYIRLYFW